MNFAQPTGVYKVSLSNPQHRAVMPNLLRSMYRAKLSLQDTIQDCVYNDKKVTPDQVFTGRAPNFGFPDQGTLSFRFVLAVQANEEGGGGVSSSAGVAVAEILKQRRIRLSLRRFVVFTQMFARMGQREQ